MNNGSASASFRLLLSQLFNFFAAFNLVHKDLGRLEARDEMFIDYESRIAGDITGNFFLALLIYETAEPTDIDVVSVRH